MVRWISDGGPDVVCLQEVPAWGLGRLGDWSGMAAFGDVAARPSIGPLPSTAAIGEAITSLNHGLFRSAFAGQGNAILVSRRLRPVEHERIVLNPYSFRRAQARWLGLGLVTRLAWAKERRICPTVRILTPDEGSVTAVNLHATAFAAARRLADAELLRAAVFADGIAAPAALCVLAGDFNIERDESATLASLESDEWGFSAAADRGIDHILVRGARGSAVSRRLERLRSEDGSLLSDHAPLEVELR